MSRGWLSQQEHQSGGRLTRFDGSAGDEARHVMGMGRPEWVVPSRSSRRPLAKSAADAQV
jgi:hypothetical protein